MTYLELKQMIETFTPERQNMEVTIYDYRMDEYFPAEELIFAIADEDRLGNGHPYLTIE